MTVEALLTEAVARREQGDSAEARALALEALRTTAGDDSRTVEAWLVLGRTSLDRCDYDAAAHELERALALAEAPVSYTHLTLPTN